MMGKVVKTILYFLACAIVFFFLIRNYQTPNSITTPLDQAAAFEWWKPVNLYFTDTHKPTRGASCSDLSPVSRRVLNAETLGPGALQALIEGPTEAEKNLGFVSSVSTTSLIQSFEVREGVAYVDFNKSFNRGVAGSCRVEAIRAQIERTLTALPDIDSVVISVNGETEGILEP